LPLRTRARAGWGHLDRTAPANEANVIDIREQFDVPTSPERVWAILSDPNAVVGCVPGATIVGQHDDGSFDANIAVKFGPTRITFRAQVTLVLDSAARRGQVTAQGKDNLGGTRVRSTAHFNVTPRDGETASTVSIDGSAEVSGRLATLIEGGAAATVKRLSGEFATCLAARCASPTPPAE
jgi:carbon monoxide dehydrogenase subunit G